MNVRLTGAVLAAALCLLPALSEAATLDRIRDGGTIKLGYRSDAAPFSSINAQGQVAGYTVALCEAVAGAVRKHLKNDALTTTYVEVSAENRFTALQNGEIDLLCGATTVTLGRRELVDFSLMTFVTGSSVLFRKDGPSNFLDLAGQKVGVRAGTTTADGLDKALQEAGIAAQVVAVKGHEDGLRALESGEISAYFADRAILAMLAYNASNPENLSLSQRFFSYEPYALALQRGDDDFRLLVDTTLVRLYRSQAVGAIYHKHFGTSHMSDLLRAMYTLNVLQQ
jgi:ABC-type amino acid transport substrate-binding protein